MIRTRLLISFTLGLMAALTLMVNNEIIAQEPPALPIRFDAGSDHPSTDHSGRLYLTDQEWTPQTQAGYIGGYRLWLGPEHPADGTPDEFLHRNQRHDWEEYRFSNVPNGTYVVTLHFSEIGAPIHTVFDVAIEGQIVLDSFNIAAQVGNNYAITRRFAATVTDGELNVTATPVMGETRLAAIEVEAQSPDTIVPTPPSDLVTTSSYNAVLLDWTDNPENDVDGYHVYRAASPNGSYVRLTTEPTHISRYRDTMAIPHITYQYCITAVDIYGNQSALTPCQPAAALDKYDATLPFYELEVSPENLLYLYNHAFEDNEVNGVFTYGGQAFPVQVRYRGGYGRFVHKKSWKIRFPGDSPFPDQSQINLRAEYPDRSLMHSKLATELFEASGVQTLKAEHVLLALNGEYLGVYTFSEHMDEGFLERTGRSTNVSVYKAVHTDAHDFSKSQTSEQAYHVAFEKKTNRHIDCGDIIAFIELINNTPDETFAYELRRVFDVATYLDYYAVIVLTGNRDFVQHNVYFLHDLDTDRWELVPYDLDGAFEPNWGEWGIPYNSPIDRGTATSPVQPWGFKSVLLTRVLDVPQFRSYYCHRLDEFMNTIFSDAVMYSLIDATYASIEEDVLRDWHKLYRENNAWFVASPNELKAYVTERKRFLQDEMSRYCPDDQPYLYINEVMVNNQATLKDPDEPSKFPGWFEIYNAGLETVDLSGFYLTNDLTNPAKFQIAEGITVPPGGHVTFFADGDPEHGPLHTNFQLDRTGGQIAIFNKIERQIDAYAFGLQIADVSEGRYPDGADHRMSFSMPTPGNSNLLRPPVITGTIHTPLLPTASDTVTVMSVISDDGALLTTTLYYSTTSSGFAPIPMVKLQRNLYTAQIPPQPSNSLVEYHVFAGDDNKQTSTAPAKPDGFYKYIVDYQSPSLIISEVMADNETTLRDTDEPGEFPDWIELYNPGPDPIDLGGRYLTDDPNIPTKFRITNGTTISAGSFLVFYADNDPEQGPLHTNFQLSKYGESVVLFDIDATANQPIDIYTFAPQINDVSEGRCLDSNGTRVFKIPTPGTINEPCNPVLAISKVSHIPHFISANDKVTITAVITGDSAAIIATLRYSIGSDFTAVPMVNTGDDTYMATVSAPPNGTSASYYVEVENDQGATVTAPSSAPVDTYHYIVGYQPPPLFINEFMADNAMTLEDPDDPGEFPDWIEIYNSGTVPIDLGGKYLTDDLTDPAKFRITDGLTIPVNGFVLFYADNDPEQGPFHTNFRLTANGESIGLFDSDITGNLPIDTYIFDQQSPDISEHRYPDGGDTWIKFRTPTPGRTCAIVKRLPYLPTVLREMMR
jgi:spore coat protein CotH